mmetsp:Transcript_5906/g.20183  ORF Transcript_5906/g.20183 Transcript_5906/m.20183 type:complete len:341 (-) Transcript_5906:1417-2439(-)
MRWFIFCWKPLCSVPRAAWARNSSACVAFAPSSSACVDSSFACFSSSSCSFAKRPSVVSASSAMVCSWRSTDAAKALDLSSTCCSSSRADAPASDVVSASRASRTAAFSRMVARSALRASFFSASSRPLAFSWACSPARISWSRASFAASSFADSCALAMAACFVSQAPIWALRSFSRWRCSSRASPLDAASSWCVSSNLPSSSSFDSLCELFVSMSSRREWSWACQVCSASRASFVSSRSCSSSSFFRFDRWSSVSSDVTRASVAFTCASTCIFAVDTAMSSRCCCSSVSWMTFSRASTLASSPAASESCDSTAWSLASCASSTRSKSHVVASMASPSA